MPSSAFSLRKLIQCLGPGLLMAGAAIGVSHLVQSTRAGAQFGFQLWWVVLLANILKYPFFEIGHRYAAATGENLVAGYARLGRPILYIFFGLNLFSAISSTAGVTLFTAGLSHYLFGFNLSNLGWSLALVAVCLGIILFGHYRLLDAFMKALG